MPATPAPPRRYSLKRGLVLLWVGIALVASALAGIMWQLAREGVDAQVDAAAVRAATACADIAATVSRSAGLADALPPVAAVDLALSGQPGLEGGLWQPELGLHAYAFPTYEGSGSKDDVPEAERGRIEALAARAHRAAGAFTEIRPGVRETLVLHACTPAPPARFAAWTFTRVPTLAAERLERLQAALALLLAFVTVSGGWLGWALTRWTRGLTRLEHALDTTPPDRLLDLPATGLAELDRLADALGTHARRARAARDESERLGRELARSERLAALGRIAAGMAHEIRNPLAALRLKAENALAASDPARARAALELALEQSRRIDTLVTGLLALTQPHRIEPVAVDLARWLQAVLDRHRESAAKQGVSLLLEAPPDSTQPRYAPLHFDPEALDRAVDNLIVNALAHTPAGGCITLAARREDDRLVLDLSDTGSGVPDSLVPRLFEPFASARPGGTGLGLALAREIVEAHSGLIEYLPRSVPGAHFRIILPWPPS